MQSARSLITDFAYSHLEYLVSLVDLQGDQACIGEYPCSVDSSSFTDGVLIDAACVLFLHEWEQKTGREEEYRQRLLRFIDRIAEKHLETWGKIYVLRMLRRLLQRDLMGILPPDTMKLLNDKTVYSDFLNADTLELINKPANYYYVAMYCAAMRSRLGFETEGVFDRIAAKFTALIQQGSADGWMDDQPPHGRYDRYTIESSRLLLEAYALAGKQAPEFVRKNILMANGVYFALRNRQGMGICYGRSISVYGECAPLQTMTYALQHGMFAPNETDEAMAYTLHIVDRLVHFWYREDMHSYNIWLDGRTTDGYRGIHRILEVNLGISLNLLLALDCLMEGGLADYVPEKDIALPSVWQWHKTRFAKDDQADRCLYVLRRGEHTFMLPFVGMGGHYSNCAYLPVMQESGYLETPVEQQLPFLVPEARLPDGSLVMPIQFFEEVREEAGPDALTIHVKGKLCRMVAPFGERTAYPFSAEYIFHKNVIRVRFELNAPITQLHMIFPGKAATQVCFPGADSEQTIDVSENPLYRTPTGGAEICRETVWHGQTVEYEITL